MYLSDTQIVGHYAERHPTLMLHVQRVDWEEIGLPSPVVAELLRGRAEFALKAIPEKIVWAHSEFLKTHQLMTKFRLLLFGEVAREEFKKILKNVKSKKRYADMMIAAMALAGDHVIVTRNTKHFKDVLPPDQLANWIDEPPQ